MNTNPKPEKESTHTPGKFDQAWIDDAAKTIERITAERDELLAACKRIVDWMDSGCDPSRRSIEHARSAIARCEASNPSTVSANTALL